MNLGRKKDDENQTGDAAADESEATPEAGEPEAPAQNDEAGDEKYVVQERLALTEDEQRLVPEESAEARWLYAIPGQEISMADAIRFGLVDGNGGGQ
jgi:hypothetical protein